MMAISLALREAHHVLTNTILMVATDNASVVSYISKQEGTHSQPCVQKFGNFLCGVIKGE